MKHSLAASLLTLATLSLHATAAVVDYVSGAPISSSSYYQYHTKWVTTTCYHTITKTKDCSYNGGDFVGDYETVHPQVYRGQDYNDYNTVYETVYEKGYPAYPSEIAPSNGVAQPYPHSEPVCYPETVYSTVYPEPSDYHTFTASGIEEIVSASPVYHTMDSTIVETVTATPSGGSECSTGPRIVNPGFEDEPWPGVWFPSGTVFRDDQSALGRSWVIRLYPAERSNTQIEQAVIIPLNRINGLRFEYAAFSSGSGGNGLFTVDVNLGSYASASQTVGPSSWSDIFFRLEALPGLPECLPVVLSIKVSFSGPEDSLFVIDNLEFST